MHFTRFFWLRCIAEVYNIGGGRYSNCSMIEAISLCEDITGNKLEWNYSEQNRLGDHIRWISDIEKFTSHFPSWQLRYNVPQILQEIYHLNQERWLSQETVNHD